MLLFSCSKTEESQVLKENEITQKKLSDYVSVSSQLAMGKIVDAVSYGIVQVSLEESNNYLRKGIVENDFNFTKAEKITFEYLGIPYYEPYNSRMLRKNIQKSEDVMDSMSPIMLQYNNNIVNVLSVFEEEEKEEGWDKDAILKKTLEKYDSLLESILVDEELKDWEKEALLSSIVVAKNFIPSFEKITFSLDKTQLTARFWNKVWKGVKKVARATANVVVKTVAVAVRTILHTGAGIINGFKEGGADGIFSAYAFGTVCGVAGVISGFFSGLRKSFECSEFNFACIMNNTDDEEYACENKPNFEHD